MTQTPENFIKKDVWASIQLASILLSTILTETSVSSKTRMAYADAVTACMKESLKDWK